MSKLILTLLPLLFIHSTIQAGSKLLDKAREESLGAFRCSSKVLSLINSNNRYDEASKATKEMQQICPHIVYSCCNLEDLVVLSNSLQNVRDVLGGDVQRFAQLADLYHKQKKSVKELFSGETAEDLKDCLGEDTYNRHDDILKSVDKSINSGDAQLKEVYNEMLSYFSGFACELCSRNFHIYEDKRLMINTNTPKVAIENAKKFAKLSELINSLNFVSEVIGCATEENSLRGNFNSKLENGFKSAIDDCLATPGDYVTDNRNCGEILEGYGWFYESKLPDQIYGSISLLNKAFSVLSTKSTKKTTSDENNELLSIENGVDGPNTDINNEEATLSADKLNRSTFYEIDKDFDMEIFKNFVVVEQDGINLPANPMDKKIWKIKEPSTGMKKKIIFASCAAICVGLLGLVYKYM